MPQQESTPRPKRVRVNAYVHKTCPVCGKEYSRMAHEAQRIATCSQECGNIYRSQRHKANVLADYDVDSETGCWVHRGRKNGGYVQVHVGRFRAAHRLFYEHHVGPIPDGMQLDHLCRNPACVNPAHLEPVTPTENVRRSSQARKNNLCKRGHEMTPENTRWISQCRTCAKLTEKRRDRARPRK